MHSGMSTPYRRGEFGRSKVRHEGLYTAVRGLTACRVDTLSKDPRRSPQTYGCIRCVAYDVLGFIVYSRYTTQATIKYGASKHSNTTIRSLMILSSSGQTIIDTVSVDMPPYENTTTGMWIDVSKEALDVLGGDAAAAIHAAAHAFLNQFPMAGDLRTECPVPQKETMKKESPRKRPGRYVL
jgi:hypothetical protein